MYNYTIPLANTCSDIFQRVIDILKLDIEGAEWTVLPDLFSSGTLNNVKQLVIEIHFGSKHFFHTNWGLVSPKDQLKVLRLLYDGGFRMFMHEHNIAALQYSNITSSTYVSTVNVISLVNVLWK